MRWWEKPMRVMRLDYLTDLVKMKEADLDSLARSKRHDWHANVEWVIGSLGAAPGLGYYVTFDAPGYEKYPPLGDFDLIREYLPYARKYGIRVLAYLNMHWYSFEFAGEHPGWEQITSDGTSYGRKSPLYGSGTTFCINSPWRDWALGMIREAIRTGIDGVFLDGPVIYPGCCYCQHCSEKFRERTGSDIPRVEDWSDPLWKEFVAFRGDSMASFIGDARDVVKGVNPDAVVYLNGGSWRSGNWNLARDMQKLRGFQDINGAEAFFHPGPYDHNLHFAGMTGKYLSAGGKPAMVFIHHALGAWHYLPLPPLEIKLSVAQTASSGANPWFAVFSYSLEGRLHDALEPVGEIYGFLEDGEDCLEGAESAAEVALLASSQVSHFYVSSLRDLYRDAGTGREVDLIADVGTGELAVDWSKRKSICDSICEDTYRGYYLALVRNHIPFDVILDDDLTPDRLRNYRLLIAPNCACLSGAQADAIKGFVEDGGGLVTSFEAGCYDEMGNDRDVSPVWEVVGIGRIAGAMAPRRGEEYLRVVRGHPITEAWRPGALIPRPTFSLKVEGGNGAEPLIDFVEPVGRLYAPLGGDSGVPAVLAGRFGEGRTVYFAFLLGENYSRYKMEDHERLIASSAIWALGGRAQVRTDAPPTVAVEVRLQRDRGRTIVHLVNCSGDMQRPLTRLFPIENISVEVRTELPARRARSLRLGRGIPFGQLSDGSVKFVLPELELYDIVVLEG